MFEACLLIDEIQNGHWDFLFTERSLLLRCQNAEPGLYARAVAIYSTENQAIALSPRI